MNRLTMMAISTLTVAATAAGGLGVASAATARTTAGSRPAAVARCGASHRHYPFPTHAETLKAITAGSVTIAPVDTGRGSWVDVYFRSGRHVIKLEAEINDAGGLTVTLTNCA